MRNNSETTPVESPVPCPVCFYDLRGQSVPHCPECGVEFDSLEEMATASSEAWHYAPEIRYRSERAAIWVAVGFVIGSVGFAAMIVASDSAAAVIMMAIGFIWCIGGSKAAWLIIVSLWRACDRRIHKSERWDILSGILLLLIYQVPFLLGIMLVFLGIDSLL